MSKFDFIALNATLSIPIGSWWKMRGKIASDITSSPRPWLINQLKLHRWQTPISPVRPDKMKYVCFIQNIPHPTQRHIGITNDLKARLNSHNEGQSPHASKFKPWKLVTYIAFLDESKALEFEKYLKSGSGRAFANKHLCDCASGDYR